MSNKLNPKNTVKIAYFSDILCVWAYIAQVRIDELKLKFAERIEIIPQHITLFGNTEERIGQGWKDKGGFDGFNQHVYHVCEKFPHLALNPNIWKNCRPKGSGTAHLFLKAVHLFELEQNNPNTDIEQYLLFKKIEWAIRLAFFKDARDVSDINVLFDIASEFSVSKAALTKYLDNGTAVALFCSEMALKETYKLDGSPTYLINENRQKLFGNVGYKILEANISELICEGGDQQASWC